ncbi:hypothetical protein C0J52_13909 [Blattella germanica]|nr:hypothetical protein C0J52_13909 [Blattella germanica]
MPKRRDFCIALQDRLDEDEFENTCVIVEHVRDSPKCNVFCTLSNSKVYGPFFFAEATVNVPQIVEDVPNFVFQQDGDPPHFHNDVREYLEENLPHRWIGRAANNLPMLQWPPRSPDITL